MKARCVHAPARGEENKQKRFKPNRHRGFQAWVPARHFGAGDGAERGPWAHLTDPAGRHRARACICGNDTLRRKRPDPWMIGQDTQGLLL